MVPEFPLSLQTRDWTGREREMSTSTESFTIRGELLMNDTTSGGTTAGAEDGIQLLVTLVTNVCLCCNIVGDFTYRGKRHSKFELRYQLVQRS